jgi:hypothetical protein
MYYASVGDFRYSMQTPTIHRQQNSPGKQSTHHMSAPTEAGDISSPLLSRASEGTGAGAWISTSSQHEKDTGAEHIRFSCDGGYTLWLVFYFLLLIVGFLLVLRSIL